MKSSPHRPSIELLFKRGLGSAEIARRLQISSSTVRNVVAAIKKRGDASEKRIIRNDGLSLKRMASQLGIARSTVQSIVNNDLKLKSYKLRRGQYLSDKSKAMRLEKCRKLLQHFQVRRVSDVIWTDEKIFTIEPLPNRQNQRQLLSKDDSMSPKRRLAHNRLFPKSVMVWAGITATEQKGKDREPVDQQHHPPPATSPAPSQHPRNPKMQAARVRLPVGVYKEFEVNRGSEGEALFRQVTSDLSIEERDYFSLCFYDKEEGIRHWLYNDKQLKNLPWEFSFEVKFYPTTPTTIVDNHTRYYVFLQLRRDILTGRLPATADTHALHGSFVVEKKEKRNEKQSESSSSPSMRSF
uniref:FERM domain-containing protein n=1 Tax=Caenorhabditis japonica TaxID=281687 RepID=A0A8R1ILB1_CAEJA